MMPVIERDRPCGPDGPTPGASGTLLRFAYNEPLIARLKALPSHQRYWTGHAWWVSDQQHEAVVKLLLRYYPEVMFLGVDGNDYVLDRNGTVVKQWGLFD